MRRWRHRRRWPGAALLALAVLAWLGLAVGRSRPQTGEVLDLARYDGAEQGAPLPDGQVYGVYSIRPFVDSGEPVELISAEVVAVDGPVIVEGVFALEPDVPTLRYDLTDEQVRALLERYEAEQLVRLDHCDRPECEVVFAVVARRTSSEGAGVVDGIKVRYRQGGREYVESTTFKVGLCLPDSTEACTSETGDADP